MNKLYLIILIVTFFISVNDFSRPLFTEFNNHDNDSLVFDGDEEYTEFPYTADDECRVVVVDSHCAYGDIYVKVISSVCGVKDTVIKVKKDQLLKKGDVLVPGSTIKTCPEETPSGQSVDNTTIAVMLPGGNGQTVPLNIELAPNSESIVPDPSSTCKGLKNGKLNKMNLEAKFGKFLIKTGQGFENLINSVINAENQLGQDIGVLQVSAVQSIIDHMHTKFSVEIKIDGSDTTDIIKVYEGTVTVKLKKTPSSDKNDTKDEIDKLQKDFKDGKITAQEFGTKMQELSQNLTKKATDMVPVDVTAGNKCTATDHSLNVEPIESDDDIWWK